MTRLRLNLLGALEARLEAGPLLAFRTRKAEGLLAYLALPAGRPHRRDELAALLWGEMSDEPARTSLRQAIYHVRKTLGAAPNALCTEGDTVALDPAAVDVDVAAFTRAAGEQTPQALERAALLYRGDLLEGFGVDEEPFEAWLMDERERLRGLAEEALARLLSHQNLAGDLLAALRTARQLLALDRLQEPVHRTLMRLHSRLGQRAAALRQYQQCVDALQRELGVEPEAETRQLYQAILRQRLIAPAAAGHSACPAATALAGPQTRLAETPLVGREAPLAKIQEAFDHASAGRGRLLAILGEAGVGKSRLVEDLMARAAHRGGRVLLGRAFESDRILLFGPFVDAFRSGELERDASLLETLGPAWRAEFSRLLPGVAAPGSPPPPELADHRRLFECIAQLVEQLAARDTMVLVLEDVHWADELSLRLLAFLGRRLRSLRVLFVVTAREEELADSPLQGTLRDLLDGGNASSLVLPRLSRSDTGALVRMLAPSRDPPTIERLGQQIWESTEGNPLMIVETMHGFRDGASLDAALPQRVREVIGRRLEQLSKGSRSLVRVAAAIGRECGFELLRRAAGCDEDAASEAVEELVRRRLLTGVGERLDFTHHQIREVAYGELPPWRRRVLHRRIAEAIETLHGHRLPDFWEALAEHFERGELWAKAAAYYLAAGERARRRYAYSTAERSCHRAAAAAARAPDDAGVRERALELLGDVASLKGDLEAANRSYQAVLDLGAGEPHRRRLVNKLHRPSFAWREGARIAFYEHGGGGETLLFMNPIVYGLEIFQPVLEQLCQDFRVITMDARGTGRSDPLWAGYGTCDHAADVRAVIEAAGGEPVTAIGISKSSSILVRLTIAAPGLVQKLVLIGSLLDFWPNGGAPPVSEVDARFREALRSGDLERALPLFVATVVTGPDTGELAEQFARNLLRLPRETVLNTWAPDPEVDVSPVLSQVQTPTLVLHGTEDRRVPLATAHYLVEHLPNARLHLFEGAGHLPIFTATAEFCEVLRRFVKPAEEGLERPRGA